MSGGAGPAPIALFIYRRPEHTRRTIEALRRCPEFAASPFYVFSDGPRTPADQAAVAATRRVARELAGPLAVHIEASENRGLASSVIGGTTRLCAEHGRVVVLEDDVVVAPQFLTYLNAALDAYADNVRIMQVAAHMFPIARFATRRDVVALPFISSWGWATWKRAWDQFDPDARGWEELLTDRQLRRRFTLEGSFDYFGMLRRQMKGESDSWAIRWNWSVFRAGGLVLYPPRSLVSNIGFDGSGTHGWRAARASLGSAAPAAVDGLPGLPPHPDIAEADYAAVRRFLRMMRRRRWLQLPAALVRHLTRLGRIGR